MDNSPAESTFSSHFALHTTAYTCVCMSVCLPRVVYLIMQVMGVVHIHSRYSWRDTRAMRSSPALQTQTGVSPPQRTANKKRMSRGKEGPETDDEIEMLRALLKTVVLLIPTQLGPAQTSQVPSPIAGCAVSSCFECFGSSLLTRDRTLRKNLGSRMKIGAHFVYIPTR